MERGGRPFGSDLPIDERAIGEPARRNGHEDVPLPRTERPDAPAYLRLYLERRASSANGHGAAEAADGDPSLPLYLRRFRAGRDARGGDPDGEPVADGAHGPGAIGPIAGNHPSGPRSAATGFRAATVAVPVVPSDPPDVLPREWTDAWAQTSRSPEIVLPPELRPAPDALDQVVDVHLIRHGETQGYSANAGLTPMGRWQAQRRGHDLSKSVRDGQAVTIACAPTARATQTAEQIRRGVEDGVALWGRRASVDGPLAMSEFRNFGVWTPSGEMDVTSAFREYHAVSERYERVALGDRPLWLVEVDRFYRLQMGGGDAIHFWMTVPLVCFEPPAAVVLRLLGGIADAVRRTPSGGRVFVATHSGPMRAFATWALGHDAGEPYNTEEVRVRVRRSLREAQVTYRSRTSEVQLPFLDARPSWWSERATASTGAADRDEELAAGAMTQTRRTQPC